MATDSGKNILRSIVLAHHMYVTDALEFFKNTDSNHLETAMRTSRDQLTSLINRLSMEHHIVKIHSPDQLEALKAVLDTNTNPAFEWDYTKKITRSPKMKELDKIATKYNLKRRYVQRSNAQETNAVVFKKRKTQLTNGGTINNWLCVNFSHAQDDVALNFCRRLADTCRNNCNMDFSHEPVLQVFSIRTRNVKKALKIWFRAAKLKLKHEQKQLDLLLVILPGVDDPPHGRRTVKHICRVNLDGVVNQCCVASDVFEMSAEFLASLASKVQRKVMGALES